MRFCFIYDFMNRDPNEEAEKKGKIAREKHCKHIDKEIDVDAA